MFLQDLAFYLRYTNGGISTIYMISDAFGAREALIDQWREEIGP